MVQVADLASEYWLLSASSDIPDKGDTDSHKIYEKAKILEARIVGLQEQILLADEDLRLELPKKYRNHIKVLLPEFLDALTGGHFGVRNGERNSKSATDVQVASAQIIASVRSGVRRRYTFVYLIKRLVKLH